MLFFFLILIGRIQILLQNIVEPLYSQQPFAHWCQHLNIKGFGIHKLRQLLLNELYRHTDNHIGIIPFQKKEIHTLIIQQHFLTTVNFMGIDNNIALRRLPENPRETDNMKLSGFYNIFQYASCSYAWKLIDVPD